jgi:hypothetical protein
LVEQFEVGTGVSGRWMKTNSCGKRDWRKEKQ